MAILGDERAKNKMAANGEMQAGRMASVGDKKEDGRKKHNNNNNDMERDSDSRGVG